MTNGVNRSTQLFGEYAFTFFYPNTVGVKFTDNFLEKCCSLLAVAQVRLEKDSVEWIGHPPIVMQRVQSAKNSPPLRPTQISHTAAST
jgi:hypothetical protein